MSQEELKAGIAREALKVCNGRLTMSSATISESMGRSIKAQLEWLVAFFEGHHQAERGKLRQLTFGHYAAREIEDVDPEFAKALFRAFYVADRTAAGLKCDLTVLVLDG